MTRVLVDEEYGYRYWVWTVDATLEEVVAAWQRGDAPLNFFNPSAGVFPGTMEEVDCDSFFESIAAKFDELMADKHMPEEENARRTREMMNVPENPCWKGNYDAHAHVHEDDDTWLRVGNVTYIPRSALCYVRP